MEALRVGRMYIRKLTPEQRNMKKDEVEYEINNKEGAYEDLFITHKKSKVHSSNSRAKGETYML